MKGFIEFIRSKGVVGLAIGIIMGTSVTKLVTALVTDIINPVIGLLLGKIGNLSNVYIPIGSAKILIGDFISSLIDFLIIAFVIYFSVKILKLDRLDKKSDKK
jgi:large conductance mechanosensitive channel